MILIFELNTRVFLYIAVFSLCYLIGSFPTAYVVVKRRTQLDIRFSGSGNVGGMNSYEVTGSKFLGGVVIAVDALKGAAAVGGTSLAVGGGAEVLSLAMFSAIIGHSYPVWLGFRGGRGLATAAGAMLVIAWVFVPIWMLVWLLIYIGSKSIHLGNIIALAAAPVIFFLIPSGFLSTVVWAKFSVLQVQYLFAAACMLLMVRHIGPLRTLISDLKKEKP